MSVSKASSPHSAGKGGSASCFEAEAVDVIVVGAGHAGCEAARAAALLGCRTILFSTTLDAVANMPCNPSIGGTAKGQLVREIDALGGIMGEIADRCAIQYRMLNQTKGPAVQSPRAQMDRRLYQEEMKSELEALPGLHLRQAEVVRVLFDRGETGEEKPRVTGVLTRNGAIYRAPAVILATGTYLGGRIFVGEQNYSGGPDNLLPALELTQALREEGLRLRRFKTGTPVRVNCHSLHLENLERQEEDERPWSFSFARESNPLRDRLPSQPCWLTWTTAETAEIIRENLDRSPLYSGDIEGVGPRYCPSIEDKIVRFPDKPRHQIFIEPMGRKTAEMYLQGLSSSLPEDVQEKIVRSLPGLEDAVIQRSAYAIEYDCLDPTDLLPTLELRDYSGLYGAGQINGSSGYEEAAAQGLMAGINAARSLLGREPVVLGRDQAYIGVLIDDLVTKGTAEPYRMMTSRAEYRLLLRQDNADARLTPLGHELGLIDDARYEAFLAKQQRIADEIARLESTRVTPTPEVQALLRSHNSPELITGTTLAQLLLRPGLDYQSLAPIDTGRPALDPVCAEEAEICIRYRGYLALEQKRIEKFRRLEARELPDDIPYAELSGLRLEARQKLDRIRPRSLGQAARISGVSPADIAVLQVYLELRRRGGEGRTGGQA